MKKGLLTLIIACLIISFDLLAQQSVSIGTTNTNPNAVLWLNSPGQNQALIIPVVNGTAAVPSPVPGMVVYDQQTNAMYYRSASTWEKLGGAVTLTAGTGISIAGSTITNTGDTNAADDITTVTPAAGDLSGTYPNPTVSRIRGVNISATTPTLNQILQYNGTNWTPSTIAVGSGTVTSVGLTMPSIFTVTNSPVTASGSLTAALNSQAAGTVLAAPSAAAGVPSFRSLSTADITGTVALAQGGTGATTAAAARTNLGLGTLSTLGAVTNTEITDGTILNADINAAAAIAGTKITPNFGAQNIVTTGSLNSAGITSTGATTLSALAGTGNRMVTANATGVLGTQAIPTTYSTLNSIPKGDGTSGLIASTITDDGSNVTVAGAFTVNATGTTVANFEGTGNPLTRYTEGGTYKGFTQIYNNDFVFGTVNPGSNVQIYNSGIQILATTTGITVPNFTRLGSTGPAIKTIKFTGNTSGVTGGTTSVTLTGVTHDKILAVNLNISYSPVAWVSNNYTINPGLEVQYYYSGSGSDTTVTVWNKSGNDNFVLNRPYVMYVTYEQ